MNYRFRHFFKNIQKEKAPYYLQIIIFNVHLQHQNKILMTNITLHHGHHHS